MTYSNIMMIRQFSFEIVPYSYEINFWHLRSWNVPVEKLLNDRFRNNSWNCFTRELIVQYG